MSNRLRLSLLRDAASCNLELVESKLLIAIEMPAPDRAALFAHLSGVEIEWGHSEALAALMDWFEVATDWERWRFMRIYRRLLDQDVAEISVQYLAAAMRTDIEFEQLKREEVESSDGRSTENE